MVSVKKHSPRSSSHQEGAVIIFCLVFLAILTLMGVSGMEGTILEERMSGNLRDYNMAFQAAESALKEAESWLGEQDSQPLTSVDGSTLVWSENAMDPNVNNATFWWAESARDGAWWGGNGIDLNVFNTHAAEPAYIIEQYHTSTSGQSIGIGSGEVVTPRVFHRITARGVGATQAAEVLVQSVFLKPYD